MCVTLVTVMAVMVKLEKGSIGGGGAIGKRGTTIVGPVDVTTSLLLGEEVFP